MTHRCHYQACLDNHGGWCYADGCKLNPAPAPDDSREDNDNKQETGDGE